MKLVPSFSRSDQREIMESIGAVNANLLSLSPWLDWIEDMNVNEETGMCRSQIFAGNSSQRNIVFVY